MYHLQRCRHKGIVRFATCPPGEEHGKDSGYRQPIVLPQPEFRLLNIFDATRISVSNILAGEADPTPL
jgi:hypothetical protein